MMRAAVPLDGEHMFPFYADHAALCDAMQRSLSEWKDADFVADAIKHFASRTAEGCRQGMQVAREKVHFYLPAECGWGYEDA